MLIANNMLIADKQTENACQTRTHRKHATTVSRTLKQLNIETLNIETLDNAALNIETLKHCFTNIKTLNIV